ncbi:hypothetical protein chiPu_0026495, partial [Chiloscyllium punctatum]|nr:hypothetical protein [Chiloscyllium punctatum]
MSPGLKLASLALVLGTARGQIPILCATAGHMQRGECCPVFWGDGSLCGSASGRGGCQRLEEGQRWAGDPSRGRDFRLHWPTYFYRRVCKCTGNYAGADCGECGYGWQGEGCQRRHTVVRRDLAKMSRGERARFVRAMQAAKTTHSRRFMVYASEGAWRQAPKSFRPASVFDVATWVHYVCSKTLVTGEGPNFAHQSTAFAVWHKLYLLYLEKEIRNITGDEDFYIPVWSWAGSANCTVCSDELFGRSTDTGLLTGPFQNWT